MNEAVFTNKEAIIDFLNSHGKGSHTKDYELMLALIMATFVQKQFPKSVISIGFKLKPEAQRLISDVQTVKLDMLAKALRNDINEDEPIDFTIGVRSPEKMGGIEFQAKRFGLGREKKGTDELIEYLNSINRKYGYVGGTLIVVIDPSDEELDIPTLLNNLNAKNYPFDRIMITWMSNNLVHIGEIYPKQGMEDIKIEDIMTY